MSNLASGGGSGVTTFELVKLIIQALVPLSIFGLGIVVSNRSKELEASIWRNQKAVEWKQQLYDRISPKLNQLFCAYTYVGTWRDSNARAILKLKRDLDSEIFSYEILLDEKTIMAYSALMDAAFTTEQGRGSEAKIRANVDMYRELSSWKDDFESLFVPSVDRVKREEFRLKYSSFMQLFFKDLGIHSSARH